HQNSSLPHVPHHRAAIGSLQAEKGGLAALDMRRQLRKPRCKRGMLPDVRTGLLPVGHALQLYLPDDLVILARDVGIHALRSCGQLELIGNAFEIFDQLDDLVGMAHPTVEGPLMDQHRWCSFASRQGYTPVY